MNFMKRIVNDVIIVIHFEISVIATKTYKCIFENTRCLLRKVCNLYKHAV